MSVVCLEGHEDARMPGQTKEREPDMSEEQLEITGKLVSINISGKESEASHELVFVINSDNSKHGTKVYKLDPFGSANRYAAMLSVLCSALAPKVKVKVKADHNPGGVPIAYMIDVRNA